MKLLDITAISMSVPEPYSYVILLNDLCRQFVIAEYMIGVQMGTLESNPKLNIEQLQAEALEIDARIKQCPYLKKALLEMSGQRIDFRPRIVDNLDGPDLDPDSIQE